MITLTAQLGLVCAVLLTASVPAHAAPAPVAAPRAFDAQIKNNTLAVSPDNRWAAAGNSESTKIIVYDLTSGGVMRELPGFVTIRNILYAPSGLVFYVSDSSLGQIVEIDTVTLETRRTFSVGAGAFGTALSRDGRTLYINNQAANTVTFLDLESGSTEAVITGFYNPRQGVKLSADGKRLHVTNFANDRVLIIDVETRKMVGELGGFAQIRAISLTRDGRTLYGANSGNNTIAVVDLASGGIVKSIPVGREPYGATLSPDESRLVTASKTDNTLTVIDLATLTPTTISGFIEPRQAIVFSKDGNTIYVLNKDLSIGVVDSRKLKLVRTLKAVPK